MPVDLIIEFGKCHQRVKTEVHPTISLCENSQAAQETKAMPLAGSFAGDRALVRKERDSDLGER